MIVKFLDELRNDRKYGSDYFKKLERLKGHCFRGEEPIIVVDNMLRALSLYFEQYEGYVYKELTSTILHELIHEHGDWYPPELDGLVYESPVSDLVELILNEE